ncbi:MAG: bifunctional ADP-dependent NAD(P)H-hydrate dehydratase/NAD(P)H-hydrate epimerase, partial [Chloroflexales bacterium]|nr:bifunctional ADP-dependent NAD(P)H-hydrate dehydratase/NAD(P)H-hydrate epimerase [Chloroflexales bacterium]
GGDGLVAARHLHDAGAVVSLYHWRRQGAEADANWQRCRQRDLSECDAAEDAGRVALAALLRAADLVIDALLGMGITRSVEGDLLEIVGAVNDARGARGAVLAIDLPTGVSSDTGAVMGAAVWADLTVATGLPKRGLLLYPGRSRAGRLALAEIGIASEDLEAIMSDTLTADYARRLLPARPADAHKGSFGKVLVVAGSLHYPGAAYLTCAGAARVGAGLVTLAGGRTVLGVATRLPEATVLPVPEGDWGAVGPNALEELGKELAGYAAVVLGPGLGKGDATREFIQRIFGLDKPKSRARVGFLIGGADAESHPSVGLPDLPPTVLDADGLNLLAEIEDWPEHLPKGGFVFTPHPGEMRRLLKVEALPDDPVATAADAAKAWGQVVVLKGATTVVASPDGRTLMHDGANPALATAGTGDVLAGAIGGLLAQGLGPYDAAALGVYLHAAAGSRVRDELGDAGTLASDLLPELPRAIKALRARK